MIVRQPEEVSMDITPIHRQVVGLDVHQNKITACALIEQPDGSVTMEHREFGGFKRDRRALAEWVRGFAPDIVVMESTGIYWKSPYAALEQVGIAAWVVNARHVKNVPGRIGIGAVRLPDRSPPTPPGMRVRTGRFEQLRL
jgi:transposase